MSRLRPYQAVESLPDVLACELAYFGRFSQIIYLMVILHKLCDSCIEVCNLYSCNCSLPKCMFTISQHWSNCKEVQLYCITSAICIKSSYCYFILFIAYFYTPSTPVSSNSISDHLSEITFRTEIPLCLRIKVPNGCLGHMYVSVLSITGRPNGSFYTFTPCNKGCAFVGISSLCICLGTIVID